jgi:hypothetical protein
MFERDLVALTIAACAVAAGHRPATLLGLTAR